MVPVLTADSCRSLVGHGVTHRPAQGGCRLGCPGCALAGVKQGGTLSLRRSAQKEEKLVLALGFKGFSPCLPDPSPDPSLCIHGEEGRWVGTCGRIEKDRQRDRPEPQILFRVALPVTSVIYGYLSPVPTLLPHALSRAEAWTAENSIHVGTSIRTDSKQSRCPLHCSLSSQHQTEPSCCLSRMNYGLT